MALPDPLVPRTTWVSDRSEARWELPLPKVCLYLQNSNSCLSASFAAAQHKNSHPCSPRGRSPRWGCASGCLANAGAGDPLEAEEGPFPSRGCSGLNHAHGVVNTEYSPDGAYGQPAPRRDSFAAFLLPGQAGAHSPVNSPRCLTPKAGGAGGGDACGALCNSADAVWKVPLVSAEDPLASFCQLRCSAAADHQDREEQEHLPAGDMGQT